jgi:hypothetical protein
MSFSKVLCPYTLHICRSQVALDTVARFAVDTVAAEQSEAEPPIGFWDVFTPLLGYTHLSPDNRHYTSEHVVQHFMNFLLNILHRETDWPGLSPAL